MSSRLKIRLGEIEVEYEGEESFLKEELPDLLKVVIELYQESGGVVVSPLEPADPEIPPAPSPNQRLEKSVAVIARDLECKTGPDLVVAATARLQLVDQHSSCKRADILAAMKSATAYYKKTYSNNLSSYLDNLVKGGRLNDVGAGAYSLSAAEKAKVNAALN